DDRPVIPDEVAEMEESDDEFALVPPQPQEPQQSFFKRKFSGGAEDLRGFETKNVGPQRELKPGHGQVTPLRIEVEELPEMEKSVDESGEATLPPRGGTTGLHVQNRGSIRTSGTASSGGIIVLEEAQEEEVATEPQKKANMAAIKIDIEGNDRTKDSVLPNEKAIDSGITKTVADRSKASGAREINGIAAVVENQVITRSELKEKALSLAEKERQQTGRKLTRTEEEELEKRALSEITEEILDREPQGANGSKFRSYANLGADIPFEMTRTYQAAPKPQQVTFPEESTAKNPFSTFSLHVSDVSFKLALEALAKGKWPAKERIRVEEFVNAIDYGDPMPSQAEKVAASQEQAIHPFLQQRNLLRIAMRTAAAGRAGQTPLRLTILLDKSGSMERPDRVATVERAFTQLVGQLFPTDQVTLLSFARQPRLLADQTREAELSKLATLAAQTPTEGGTNLEAALLLAFEKAEEQKLIGAQNRIVLITDGAANLGDADPERLSRLIETIRDRGIAFDAAGVGAEGLNDEILEALTRKGDGRYYLLNGPEDADDGFAKQIAGALRPAAKNVKIQVEFNPERVGRYKLIGFEKHRLKKEDFRNDKVDAAEMAAEEAGVALYQIEPLAEGSGDIGSVSIRFRDMASGEMVERRWPIPYEPTAPRLDQAAPSMKLATCAALLGSKLKDDELGQTVDLGQLARYAASLQGERAGQLRQMIQQARDLTNE
ncbi:MAG: von Willebrand factor type A domain-containing protein, partial [Verrucomicrobiota bacterium]